MCAGESSPCKETPADALAELERFVVENDDLLALEERIGRFNIFDALGIVRAEIRHSNFLAWLLDPRASHGQGDAFLKAVLTDMFREARSQGIEPPTNLVELDGGDLDACEVRREWRNIDLLLIDRERRFVVVIENKVDSSEHSDQLKRYQSIVKNEYAGFRRLHVYLTPDGEDPSDEEWASYSYKRLHGVLGRVRRTGEGAIGSDVRLFLDHYLNLLETRLMDDERIGELCRRIYSNHRRAIDLVIQHAASPADAHVAAFTEAIRNEPDAWVLGAPRGDRCVFAPRSWLATLLPEAPVGNSECGWLTWQVVVRENRCEFRITAWPSDLPEQRVRVIERLIADPVEFGLKPHFRTWRKLRNTRLLTEEIASWSDEEAPAEQGLVEKVKLHLESRLAKLRDVPQAIEQALRE